MKDKHEIIGDVRGMGLMQAIELVEDRETKEPATGADRGMMLEATRENGLLVGKGGLYGNVIRVTPPMNIGAQPMWTFHRAVGSEPDGVRRVAGGGGAR